MRGIVLHCGRHGCVVKLDDGRFANLSKTDGGYALAQRALRAQRNPALEFIVSGDERWPRLTVAASEREDVVAPARDEVALERNSRNLMPEQTSSTLDDKIIEYLRQTADWDPTGALASRAIEQKKSRAEKLLAASEQRARRATGGAKRSNSKKR